MRLAQVGIGFPDFVEGVIQDLAGVGPQQQGRFANRDQIDRVAIVMAARTEQARDFLDHSLGILRPVREKHNFTAQ